MNEYLLYVILFLLGYAIGKTPFILEFIKLRTENNELKKDITVLKEFLGYTGRGRIYQKPVQDESRVQDKVQDKNESS